MKITYDKQNHHLTATEKAAIKRCWEFYKEFYNSPAFFDLKSDYMIFKKKAVRFVWHETHIFGQVHDYIDKHIIGQGVPFNIEE